jgi:hypothetical protein
VVREARLVMLDVDHLEDVATQRAIIEANRARL